MFPRIVKIKDTRDLLIREAEGQDASDVLAYIERVCGETDFLSFGPGEFELGEVEEAAYLERCLQSANCIYLLAFVDETLAGALSFSSRSRPRLIHVGELGITVRKTFWGQGIGAALLDVLIDWATASDLIKKINLKVRTDNHRAVKLYTDRGFTVEGMLKKETFIDGKYFDLLHMAMIV